MTDTSSEYPRVFLRPGRDKRVSAGHPWAYSNEIRMDDAARSLAPGSLAVLARVDGKPLGVGTFNPHTLIAFRLFERDPAVAVDEAFLAGRLARALALRDRLFDTPHYRLVHAEADGLPGLVVDRFGAVAVVQVSTAGMEALTPTLLEALEKTLAPEAVLLRNDGAYRALENLESYVRMAKGDLDGPIALEESGLTFFADPLSGQKTGWFFDQRDSRAFVARLCAGMESPRVLDIYSYGGGFAVSSAAAGAQAVTAVDTSANALDLARRAAEANGIGDRVECIEGEAFAELERRGAAGERFDLVVADPPAFVKSRKDLKTGLKGYRKLARMAARLVRPSGFLFIASCSHNVDAADFAREVSIGITRAGREGRILRSAGAGPDHPVHPFLPESAYLKSLVLQLD